LRHALLFGADRRELSRLFDLCWMCAVIAPWPP
jgi:hypothetical protein